MTLEELLECVNDMLRSGVPLSTQMFYTAGKENSRLIPLEKVAIIDVYDETAEGDKIETKAVVLQRDAA